MKETKPSYRPMPVWANRQLVLDTFKIGWRRLDDWVTRGWVRTVKLDETDQGRRLYSCEDIDRTLSHLAKGYKPRWGQR